MPESPRPGAGEARRGPTGRRFVLRPGLALGLLLAGCSFVSTRTQPYVGVPTFPPTDPARVEILRSEPVRPLNRLGEVFLDPSGEPTVAQYEQALREAGAKMPIVGRVVVGLAIRYSGP